LPRMNSRPEMLAQNVLNNAIERNSRLAELASRLLLVITHN
jgi:hypothetical protein